MAATSSWFNFKHATMQVVNLTVLNGKCLLIEATQWASISLRPLSQRKNMDRINLFYLGWSPPTDISWQIQITTSAIGLVKNGSGSSQRSILINMPKMNRAVHFRMFIYQFLVTLISDSHSNSHHQSTSPQTMPVTTDTSLKPPQKGLRSVVQLVL